MSKPDSDFEMWCRCHLNKMDETLKSIDEALRGPKTPNGRVGVFGRLDRLEVAAGARIKAQWGVWVAVVAIVVKQAWDLIVGA